MELKTYFAQDRTGNLIPSAIVSIYLTGTTTLASGLTNVSGAPIGNPFTADSDGKIQFRAPDGIYDMQVALGSTTGVKVTFQCVDVEQQLSDANNAADRAESAADSIQQQADQMLSGFSFTVGATLESEKDFIWNDADKTWYYWTGVFPKTVTEGSAPTESGWIGTNSKQLQDNLSSTDAGKGASMVALSSGETVQEAINYVTPAAGEIIGDGSDESAKLSAFLAANDGRKIDLSGLTISFQSPVSVAFTKDTEIKNGKLIHTGSANEFGLTLRTAKKLIIDGVDVSTTNAAKTARILATSATAQAELRRSSASGGKQTTGLGLAAGFFFGQSASGFKFTSIVIDSVSAKNIDSDLATGGVGRGIFLTDFDRADADNLTFENIGPYTDGDGIFAQEVNTPGAVLRISNVTGIDCQKRVVKSQVKNTRVSDVVARRTQAFTAAGGQSEVSLQSGGTLDGLTCFYADGAAPQSIAEGFNYSNGLTLRNISVHCENPDNVIKRIITIQHPLANTEVSGWDIGNITFNCKAECLGFFFSVVGTTDPAMNAFKDVIFDSIYGREVTTAAFIVSRGTSNNVKVSCKPKNIQMSAGNAPMYYLDPAPGTTTLLGFDAQDSFGIAGINTDGVLSSMDSKQRTFSKRVAVAENAAGTLSFNLLDNVRGAVKIFAAYTPNRDTDTAHLYTEGWAFNGATASIYKETIAGNKTQTGQGTISISVSGRTVTLSKTAGSLTASGLLELYVVHHSNIATA